MSAVLAEIVRHPLKAIGRESLSEVTLRAGEALPWDRAFAVAHARAKPEQIAGPWAHKMNYLRGVTGPSLMAVSCAFDADHLTLTLSHPERPPLEFRLTDDPEPLLEWLAPIWPGDAPAPTALVHHSGTAQTDVPEPWIAINSLSSHAAVADRLGRMDLSIHRWRGNLWVDGWAPWAERDMLGQTLRIGDTTLLVEAEITRCKATMANPQTGRRDADTLGALEAFGHQEFGVYARVLDGGRITPGTPVEAL